MRIEVTDISDVKKSLSVEVDADVVDRETTEVVKRYAREARIPGFRAGKAPRKIVEARFASDIRGDVRDRLLARLYSDATKEKGLRPLGDPTVDEISFEPGAPFSFKTTFEILPELDPQNYHGVEVTRREAAVEAAEVDKTLEELRESRSRLVTEEERAAETGDFLVASLKGAPEGGEGFEQERTFIEVGSDRNLPRFNENLLGAKAGDELRFNVEFPAEYPAEEMAGKTVDYEIEVHEVKRREIPELDDEFAKDLGDFADLAALRQRVEDDLLARKKAEVEGELRQSILDKVLRDNPVPLPEVLVEDEVRHRLEDLVRHLVSQGMDPRQMDLDWKELREKQLDPARKTVHARILLDAVARKEGLEVASNEVEKRIRAEAARAGEDPVALRRSLKEGGGMEALKNQILREKSLDLLLSVANILREES